MSKEANDIRKWEQIVEKMKEAEKVDTEDEDESPEEEATEDAEMKKGTKKASEKDVIEFLRGTPNPDDDAVHDWATENGYEIHGLEKMFYKLASDHVKEMDGGEEKEKE